MASTDIIGRRALNLRGVKLVEKAALEIVEDCPHVALYRFLSEEARWVRMEIEGSCFVTRNCEAPFYSFLILNKKGEEDLILHVQEDIEKARIQETYLMLRCKTAQQGLLVLGVWIHEEQERNRMFESLNRILEKKNVNSGADLMNKLNNLKLQASAQKLKKQPEAAEEPPAATVKSSSSNSYANIVSGAAPSSPVKSSSTPSAPPKSAQKSMQLLSLLKTAPAEPPAVPMSNALSSPTQTQPAASAKTPGTAQKRNALLSILKASGDTGGSGEVKEPTTPPASTSHSAIEPYTPPATSVISPTPVSAVKSNKLLSLLKNPSVPAPEAKSVISVPVAQTATPASTPNKTAQLLSLIKKDNNGPTIQAVVTENKVQEFLTDAQIADSFRMGAKVLQNSNLKSAAKPSAASGSESRIEDIIANTAKSRSNSMGEKVEKQNNNVSDATQIKKERSNSNTEDARRERMKNLLISPSMLEG